MRIYEFERVQGFANSDSLAKTEFFEILFGITPDEDQIANYGLLEFGAQYPFRNEDLSNEMTIREMIKDHEGYEKDAWLVDGENAVLFLVYDGTTYDNGEKIRKCTTDFASMIEDDILYPYHNYSPILNEEDCDRRDTEDTLERIKSELENHIHNPYGLAGKYWQSYIDLVVWNVYTWLLDHEGFHRIYETKSEDDRGDVWPDGLLKYALYQVSAYEIDEDDRDRTPVYSVELCRFPYRYGIYNANTQELLHTIASNEFIWRNELTSEVNEYCEKNDCFYIDDIGW